jgi:hypothetical protein
MIWTSSALERGALSLCEFLSKEENGALSQQRERPRQKSRAFCARGCRDYVGLEAPKLKLRAFFGCTFLPAFSFLVAFLDAMVFPLLSDCPHGL